LDGLGQKVQRRHQHENAALGDNALCRCRRDDGLSRSARGVYLPAQAINGNAARRDIETAHNGGNGLDLMVTQFHGHSRVLLFRGMWRAI
jgi:hypothetical protein